MTYPLPPEMADLPTDKHGRPVPFFVETLSDGSRDFRISSKRLVFVAVRDSLCWVCGNPRDQLAAFVIGPMCAVNRNNAEPPSHMACALYSARMCPFLSRPTMRRREVDVPDTVTMAGVGIMRNPGVCAVWRSATWQAYQPQAGAPGLLFDIGDPVAVSWWTGGRSATGDEVRASIASGLPLLEAEIGKEDRRGWALLRHSIRKVEGMIPA